MANKGVDDAWDKELRALGLAVKALENAIAEDAREGRDWHGVRFKTDADEGTSVLAVLTSSDDAGEWVAFVGGLTLSTTILAMRRKLEGPGLKWRPSVPYGS
jgi:hypothetical protein